jgi:GNAT superfamily N-acetyltransferase
VHARATHPLLLLLLLPLQQAEAVLPPPFPTRAPLQAYISNMSVAPDARQRGLARRLCRACGRVAVAWRQPRVVLHVAVDNAAARALYSSVGFRDVPGSSGLTGLVRGPWTQQRMVADAAALAWQR